ncbi:uncharacterized protein LOC110975139 isoform X9 [Acanthaster planci]|uniref:Uncharacterized protein LOC110975139 isoform X9 n=1 Tax=Acanthaster planci TaxID=133434 RepID=A0A8B7XQ84_ACAPL|nr:uncharacterized protein LOC110975139 isoform X9 [Acanthaster planci]
MANGCLRKIATRDMLVGMGHEDYHCSVCHKWLDQEPRMCSDKRTCYYCYMEIQIKRPEKCPVCEETFEPDEHFVKDKRAAKDMKRSTAKCCTCGREMAMSALREHQEECGGVESLPQQIDERGPPEDHCPTQMHVDEQDPPEDPAQEEGKGSNEPIISCLYKMFGCDFQGTNHQVKCHLKNVPTPKCRLAQLQQNALLAYIQQLQDTLERIQELQSLVPQNRPKE